jgi:magnesium transporter
MVKKKSKASYARKAGLPPESLVYTGNKKPSPGDLDILVYDEQGCVHTHLTDTSELKSHIDSNKVNLLIINNITDINLIDNVGKFFEIPVMMLEDVLNTSHLPKVEESGDELLMTLKYMEYSSADGLIQQHISLILGPNYVIVFKDFENKLFEDIKTRIVNGKSKARIKKADYLFYLLTDTLIDTFYGVINEINNEIDKLEIQLLEKPEFNYIQGIYKIKQPLNDMRGVIFPIREALMNIVQGDYSQIEDATIPYLQDVKDHINHIIHMYDRGRDTLSDLIDLNSSNINNKMNRSMKVLTIITTLFIPLTLIAGIYGMNFRNIPELGWKFGYPYALALMLITSVIMLLIMRRNKLF